VIKLNASDYIGKGAERKCYKHPNYDDKVIKVEYITKQDRNQNRLDKLYYSTLKCRNISYKHIAHYYGEVATDQGVGAVFEYIKDYDEKNSINLEEAIKEKILSIVDVEKQLNTLRIYLEENNIMFGDVVLSNILCQKTAQKTYRLVIVDGLGARRIGWKFWLQRYSKLYHRYRMKKQWKKLIFNYNELLNS